MKKIINHRMVVSYIPVELHKKIRKWCISNDASLHEWAEKAHDCLAKTQKSEK